MRARDKGAEALRVARKSVASFRNTGLAVPGKAELVGCYELNGGCRLTHPNKQAGHVARQTMRRSQEAFAAVRALGLDVAPEDDGIPF